VLVLHIFSILRCQADAEKIDILREYAGTAMPTFLFYKVSTAITIDLTSQDGKLVEVQKGVDPPKLVELMEQLTPQSS